MGFSGASIRCNQHVHVTRIALGLQKQAWLWSFVTAMVALMVVIHRSTCCSYIPSMTFKLMDLAPTVVGWPCVCIVRQAHGLALCVRRMLSWHSHSSNVWWCVTTYVQEPRCSQAYMPHSWNCGTVASLRPAFPHRASGKWFAQATKESCISVVGSTAGASQAACVTRSATKRGGVKAFSRATGQPQAAKLLIGL